MIELATTTQKGSQWERADNYRAEFLKHNKGLFGCLYFCAYCGRPLTRKKMQVDHHIAVGRVQKNPLYKLYLGTVNTVINVVGLVTSLATGKKFVKSEGVNVRYNLIPACPKCNNRKKDKGGLWIVRGAIGGTIWKICNAINNLILWLISKPLVQGIIIGALAFAVIQYFAFGTGVIATLLGFGKAIMGFFAAITSVFVGGNM